MLEPRVMAVPRYARSKMGMAVKVVHLCAPWRQPARQSRVHVVTIPFVQRLKGQLAVPAPRVTLETG